MATTDAGQHGRDMAVADLERLTELSVAPGDAGEAPFEGADRKLHAAAFDLRSEVEADRLRVGRRLGKPLAAQPRGEVSPVSRVGALGVIGLGRAGVGLGSLRERRKAAAEASGGREQGRGCAGSLGLRRRAFRLQAVRAVPDALHENRASSRMARWRRAGRAPPIGEGRAGPGLASRPGVPRRFAFRRARTPAPRPGWLPVDWLRGSDQLREGWSTSRAGRGPARAGQGRAPRPRRTPTRRSSDASARFPGSADERRFRSDGPGAWAAAGRRPAPSGRERAGGGRVRTGASRGVFRRLGRLRSVSSERLREPSRRPQGRFRGFSHGRPSALSNSCPIMEAYRTSPPHDKLGGFLATQRDKAPQTIHHAPVIRTDLELLDDHIRAGAERFSASSAKRARAEISQAKAPERHAPAPIPAWARANGRAGEGGYLFAAGAGLALLDAHLRAEPPAAGALRSRLALQSAAASAKILRLNADEAALRDLRFAVGEPGGPAANLLSLWRDGAGRPPDFDPGRIRGVAARLDLAVDPNGLAASLGACAGEGDPVSAAAKAAALAFSTLPDASPAEAEILALWAFDMVVAIRLRWPRPVPLIATKILDPSLRSNGRERLRLGGPAWPNAAAGAIALAAASVLDLAASLSRRSEILLAVAPKLRAKPAAKIVDLLLSQDCVSPAEAARQAPMTGRAARRLFDRLLSLGAVRELSGRPAFRLYGL